MAKQHIADFQFFQMEAVTEGEHRKATPERMMARATLCASQQNDWSPLQHHAFFSCEGKKGRR
jgi:hypothetical protein